MLMLTTQATSWTGSRWICHRLQDLVDSQGRSLRLHDGCQDGNPILEIGGSLLWTQVSGIHRRRQDWGPVPVHHTQETLHTCQAWCRRAVFSRSTFSIFMLLFHLFIIVQQSYCVPVWCNWTQCACVNVGFSTPLRGNLIFCLCVSSPFELKLSVQRRDAETPTWKCRRLRSASDEFAKFFWACVCMKR